MAQQYNAHFKQSMQCTEDKWELVHRSILIDENTTIGEIIAQYQNYHKSGAVIVQFIVSEIFDLTNTIT